MGRRTRRQDRLRDQGWDIEPSVSQIVPVVVGLPETALALSADLAQLGCNVPAIRPPSVPAETSRLRISLSAAHTPEAIDTLAGALASLRDRYQFVGGLRQ